MSDPFPNPGKIQSAFRKTKCILNKAFLSFQLQKAKLGPRACFQIIILKGTSGCTRLSASERNVGKFPTSLLSTKVEQHCK